MQEFGESMPIYRPPLDMQLLFACWPFTRLVRAFSAPVAYLFRPYDV
jgi:hypothetical protein